MRNLMLVTCITLLFLPFGRSASAQPDEMTVAAWASAIQVLIAICKPRGGEDSEVYRALFSYYSAAAREHRDKSALRPVAQLWRLVTIGAAAVIDKAEYCPMVQLVHEDLKEVLAARSGAN